MNVNVYTFQLKGIEQLNQQKMQGHTDGCELKVSQIPAGSPIKATLMQMRCHFPFQSIPLTHKKRGKTQKGDR